METPTYFAMYFVYDADKAIMTKTPAFRLMRVAMPSDQTTIGIHKVDASTQIAGVGEELSIVQEAGKLRLRPDSEGAREIGVAARQFRIESEAIINALENSYVIIYRYPNSL